MKKIYTLSLLLAFTMSFGQTIMYEGFDYTGNIGGATASVDAVGSNGWFTHSNSLAGTINVDAGSLSYIGIAPSTGNKVVLPGANSTTSRDVNKPFSSSTANTLYFSTIINVVDNTQLVAIASANAHFMGFGATSGSSVPTLGARLGAVSSSAGTKYRLNISNISTGTITYTENPVDLDFGINYLVVVKYERSVAPTVATLWVNPTSLGGAEPTSTVTNNSGTATFPTFGSIYLRNASATPKVQIDEIKVGVNWSDVTSSVLSNKKFDSILGLKVYPNPAKNNLFISSDSNEIKQVEIYNVLGKVVLNTKVTNASINISAIAAGVYVVKITEAGKTATRKLVIE